VSHASNLQASSSPRLASSSDNSAFKEFPMTFSSVTPLVLLIRSIDEETTRKIIYRNVIDKHQLNNLQANAAWQHP
jgi:hypothetical protein